MVASPGSPLELRDGITSAGELDSRPRVQLASRTCEGVEAGFVCAEQADPVSSAKTGGCSSAGRAPDLHSGGRRFDPDQLHQTYGPVAQLVRAHP